jgi:uncharacterized protein YhbP (UPF0306 family)
MTDPVHADIARDLIDTNNYLVLGTADAAGTPWVSPVFYVHRDYRDFYWASAPTTRHSHNVAVRPDIGIAIYDSHSPVGHAEAVYLAARAALVPDDELEHTAAIYNSRLPGQKQFDPAALRPPALLRLYRATAIEHSVLVRGGDPRHGRGADSRITVTIQP